MYAQPVYAEARFTNAIEYFFSRTVESNWTPIFEKLGRKETIDQSDWENIVQFVCSMLVRVPLTFDAVVELLQESVQRSIAAEADSPPDALVELYRKKMGEAGAKRVGLKELIDAEMLLVDIDPHRCVTSMAQILGNIAIFQPGVSFGVPKILHNCTALPFLSSDNPVCFYGGPRDVKDMIPYTVRSNSNFSFVFPLSSRMALVNSVFVSKREMHVEVCDRQLIADINKIVAKFSHRYVFGENDELLAVGRKLKHVCPRPDFEASRVGDGVVERIAYRFDKPKRVRNSWTYDIER